MKYFRWTHKSSDLPENVIWNLTVDLDSDLIWKLRKGNIIENWDFNKTAYYQDEVEYTDYPFTTPEMPIYSDRLREIVQINTGNSIQFLPICIQHTHSERQIPGYWIANYLCVLDCLDRDSSDYQIWTKENLLYWEKRPFLLGRFRDVKRAVLKSSMIGDVQLFRLWGWETMVIIREDLKIKLEAAKMTGCLFSELDSI